MNKQEDEGKQLLIANFIIINENHSSHKMEQKRFSLKKVRLSKNVFTKNKIK